MNHFFTFDKGNKNKPVARVKGGESNNLKIYLTDDETSKTKFEDVELDKTSKFQPLPNPFTEREIFYISAPSGAGKSTFCKNFLEEYHKRYPEAPVYLFSALKEDETLDKLDFINRIKISPALKEFQLEDVPKKCMFIFDDCDVITDKKSRDAVYTVMGLALECGRHRSIDIMSTNHLPTDKGNTRRILNEAHYIVYFPNSGQVRGINYLLENYVGMDKKQIKMIKGLNSRWACIYKHFPQYVLTERNLFFFKDSEE